MRTKDIQKVYQSHSPEQTESLASDMGARLRGGEVIELMSDLGGGKTTFVRGLVRGAGSTDRVMSPTFTLAREYTAGQLVLSHFDFYRLGEAGLAAEELAEVIQNPYGVTVIEWGDVVRHVLPHETIKIVISPDGETMRTIAISCPAEFAYLMGKEQS